MYAIKVIFLVAIYLTGSLPVFSQSSDTSSFKVYGSCRQCKQRIEKSLKIKGVSSSTWDLSTKILTVIHDPKMISESQLHEKVSATGHDTEKQRADDRIYKGLPECCLYRDHRETSYFEHENMNGNKSILIGLVVESDNEELHPLAGATIETLDNKQFVVTNSHGEFMLTDVEKVDRLAVSFAGYKTDTISIPDMRDIQIILDRNDKLKGIVVTARKRPYSTETRSPFRTTLITKGELLKAACCNLSESFETSPAVDVVNSDAATGSKQVQLLGLAGIYTQLTVENLPGPRGIGTHLGLNSIAGPWIESIQVIKGTGSVANGFESMAGQINVELRKPGNSEKLYLNGYINSIGKTDINANIAHRISKKWSTNILLHNDFLFHKEDFDEDGFRDLPTGNLFSAINRWEYQGEKGLFTQFGFKLLNDNRTGGELEYNASTEKLTTLHYGLGIDNRRYEVFGKTGYVFPGNKYESIGLQVSAFIHEQDTYFGLRQYDADQKSFYSNLIYQTRLASNKHSIKTGFSFVYDNIDEKFNDIIFDRVEFTPGFFVEYAYQPKENLEMVAGMRTDHNSLYGWFVTPRFNLRYAPFSRTTVRINAGRGQRTANIIAENMGLLVSSRQLYFPVSNGDNAYGLDKEVSWNTGIGIDQKFRIFNSEASLGLDFYHTDFSSQVIVDLENPGYIRFYDLSGKSFSNSFQAELNFIPLKHFDVRIAYRYFDVKTSYQDKLLEKPFTARHRAFINLAYEHEGWAFDYTMNLTGRKRIPSTMENPVAYRMHEYSPSFLGMNAQVSRSLGKKKLFELYAGGENLGNFFQEEAILSADQPFSSYFDASLVWGPLSGRLWYTGFRYTIK